MVGINQFVNCVDPIFEVVTFCEKIAVMKASIHLHVTTLAAVFYFFLTKKDQSTFNT